MPGLSYIDVNEEGFTQYLSTIPLDESVGGMLFDLSGFSDPFALYPDLYSAFKDCQVQCVSNMDEVKALGITEGGFLNGLPYYHLSQFYDYIGGNQPIYLCFADCSENWEAIEIAQRQCNGKMFQIGVWTSQPLWSNTANGDYNHTSLILDLQAEADEVNGKMGTASLSPIPLSIILCANSNAIGGGNVDYRKIPDAIALECPKISVLLAQNGTEAVHAMQASNPAKAPVGALGMAMATLALCGVEESIGSAMNCDLNKNEQFTIPEWGFGADYSPISRITRSWANTISLKGYIIPVNYPDLEASYFFSNDQTLSSGSFSTIANNRTMHKCRRAVCSALLPFINGHHYYSFDSKSLSPTAETIITNAIFTLLDSAMLNKAGKRQISDRKISFETAEDMLETDSMSLKLEISPINYSSYISESVLPLSF